MAGVMDYVRGSVRVQIGCRYPERILNICAAHGVDFRDLERREGELLMTVSVAGYRTLRSLRGGKVKFTMRTVGRRGVPIFLWRVRKRYVLMAGLVLCLGAVWISSFFIWQIDVEGNEAVPDWEILACLKKLGVDIGESVMSVKAPLIQDRMLLMIPELAWITLNTSGSRIEVLVREKTEAPQIIDPNEATVITAEKGGIITRMLVYEGKTLAAEGDTVAAGDELVTGIIPGGDDGVRLVHASAQVWARTWYEYSAKIPLETLEKEYTGAVTERTAVILGGKRINLYFSGGNPYEYYDKMTVYETLELPGAGALPVTVIKETYEEYVPVTRVLTEEAGERILRARLLDVLSEATDGGSVLSADFASEVEDGVMTVTMRAECLEDIGFARELTPEEREQAARLAEEIKKSLEEGTTADD